MPPLLDEDDELELELELDDELLLLPPKLEVLPPELLLDEEPDELDEDEPPKLDVLPPEELELLDALQRRVFDRETPSGEAAMDIIVACDGDDAKIELEIANTQATLAGIQAQIKALEAVNKRDCMDFVWSQKAGSNSL